MSNDRDSVLICVDPQPGFMTPEGRLPVPSGACILPFGHDAGYDDLISPPPPSTVLEALARAWSEPPLDPPTHVSFAKPGQPAFSVIPDPDGKPDINRLWPMPHCVIGERN